MIDSKDISVVVQGPILHQDERTKRVLESVRKHLPNAELILSTWKGSDTSGLDCDALLLNDDPGILVGVPASSVNLNRQIASTRNGLQKATRHYAMKLRTDTLLTGTGFLDAFDRYPERRDDFKVFQHKIVVPTLFTRNPLRMPASRTSLINMFFHPSDLFQFGLRDDLSLLWNISLAKNNMTLFPEQYIWINCLRDHLQDIDYLKLNLKEQLKLSEISLTNNFIVETPTHLAIELTSRMFSLNIERCYTLSEIKYLHIQYIIRSSNSVSLISLFRLLLHSLFIFISRIQSRIQLNVGFRRFIQKILKNKKNTISIPKEEII
ncbi:MAG: WavE lipopolysaccharide synthesis family protein [Chloroherpetonaceae bacterium]